MQNLAPQESLLGTTGPGVSYEVIAAALEVSGWGLFTDLLPRTLCERLAERARVLDTYQPAGIGRRATTRRNAFVRRDRIVWIDDSDPAGRDWLLWTEGLRLHLNRTLLLGLQHFESHFACYPPGAFYRRHLDAFRGETNRVVSVVCYLNDGWLPADGGELVLYDENDTELGRFPPTLGTLAVYLSEQFPHEVLPTRATRYSLAGWFRCRAGLPLANL